MNNKLAIAVGGLILVVVAVIVVARWRGAGDESVTSTTVTTATTTPACPHSPGDLITIALSADKLSSLIGPSPRPTVCPKDEVLWTLTNHCTDCKDVTARIDKRQYLGTTTEEDFLEKKQSNGLRCDPEGTAKVGDTDIPMEDPQNANKKCKVKQEAINSPYKYYIEASDSSGKYTVDPEVEVQGGAGIDTNRSPGLRAQTPTPGASPSR